MIVEDELIVWLDLLMMFFDNGYEIVGEVGDGEKVVELVFVLKSDLIIMDIKMFKLNGLKVSEIILNKYNIFILLLIVYSQREFIDKVKKVNIVGYLVKLIVELNLILVVEIVL